jgi:hypothetical protein
MPHDPIARWEWEGGALAAHAGGAEDEKGDEARDRSADPAAGAEGEGGQSRFTATGAQRLQHGE